MRNEKTLQNTFSACSSEGSFTPLAKIDVDKINSMVRVALTDLESVKNWQKKASKESGQWNAIYKVAYDVLHTLAEALLSSERVKARTHECVFSYLCEKHPELVLDWNFFEKVRSIRNRSIYYGEPASYKHWNEVELQMMLYIDCLRKAVEKKLK